MHTTIKNTSTLFDFAAASFPEASRTAVRDWIASGRFVIDEQVMKDGRKMVMAGQSVQFISKPSFKGEPFPIVYEDEDVVVVDKPAGLLSVAREIGDEKSVHSYLKERYRKSVFVVHRLDQETSGLILFARTYSAFIKLKEELKDRKMKRCYEAIVEGSLQGSGVWEGYLKEEGIFHVRCFPTLGPDCEYAVTEYKVLKSSQKFSRIECLLQTGKRHQIRVHSQQSGHPVAGDKRYGSVHEVPRLCLHAKELVWTHPVTGKVVKLTSPTPKLFDRLVAFRHAAPRKSLK